MQVQATATIKALFMEALDTVPAPLTEDVIDDVFFAIEQHPSWRKRYDELCLERGEHGKQTVNGWGAFWVARAVDCHGIRQVPSVRNTLTQTYSKLDEAAPAKKWKGTAGPKKAKEEAAREAVFAYYKAHKEQLSPEVLKVKEDIVELVMTGLPLGDAFSVALNMSGGSSKSPQG